MKCTGGIASVYIETLNSLAPEKILVDDGIGNYTQLGRDNIAHGSQLSGIALKSPPPGINDSGKGSTSPLGPTIRSFQKIISIRVKPLFGGFFAQPG